MMVAARNGNLEEVRRLIQAGAALDDVGRVGQTSLHFAASHGYTECVKALVEARADVDMWDDHHYRPLHNAASPACVKALVEARADVNVKGFNSETPLHRAAMEGQMACVKALVELRADVNIVDCGWCTPLHHAAMEGQTACVKALVESGADIHAKQSERKTPLDLAKKDEIKKLLQEAILVTVHGSKSETGAPTVVCTGAMSGEEIVTVDAHAEMTVGQVGAAVAAVRGVESRLVKLLIGSEPLEDPNILILSALSLE